MQSPRSLDTQIINPQSMIGQFVVTGDRRVKIMSSLTTVGDHQNVLPSCTEEARLTTSTPQQHIQCRKDPVARYIIPDT